MRRVFRTKCVPLIIVYGADVSAGTPFLSFTEYLHSAQRNSLILNTVELEARVGIGLQTPRFREKMAHLEPLLKHNPPLSGITQTYTVGVRFGVRIRSRNRAVYALFSEQIFASNR